jgi:hypothetical protein
MNAAHHMRSCRSRAAALCALLSLAAIAPSRVQAGCARHEGLLSPQSGHSAHLDALDRAGALSTAATPGAPRPKPCSGVLCSGKPAVPPAPVLTIGSQPESWACPIDEIPAITTDSARMPADADLARPVRVGLPIFHPPRQTVSTSL